MPREAIVDLPCRVKYELGGADLRLGSRTLVNLIHAREMVDYHRARPRQDGKPIEEVRVKLPVLGDECREEQEHSIGELETQTAGLVQLEPYCANCPANAHRRSFGCIGGLKYPIKSAVEQYALDRVASPDRIGGALLLETLQGADGSHTRGFRAESKFEALSGPSRKLPENTYRKTSLTADELFEPLLIQRGFLPAWMALNVLLWFDAVTLDNKVPATVNDVLTMTRMEVTERPKRTKSHLGVHSPGARSEDFRGFLKLLYVGWSRDLPVAIDS